MSDIKLAHELVNELFDKIGECQMSDSSYGVNCGYRAIDDALAGFNYSSLNVIASRPAMGKSSFIETMMLNMSTKLNLSVLYFSLESTAEGVVARLMSSMSGIATSRLKSCNLTSDEWQHLKESTEVLKKANLYIESPNNITIDAICKQVRDKFKRHPDINALFIDYLQLIAAEKSNSIVNREQEIGHVVRTLKFLARELNIPIFITSQLNRRSANEKRASIAPQLEDLRDSGVIEDVADTIIFIHRPEYYGMTYDENGMPLAKGFAEIDIIKNRHGSTHKLVLQFKKESVKFVDMDDSSQEPDSIEEPEYIAINDFENAPF